MGSFSGIDKEGNPSLEYMDIADADPTGLKRSQEMTDRAANTDYTGQINQDVQQKSNLLGDSQQETPEEQALKARSRQSADSQINAMMRQAQVKGIDWQTQNQGQNMNQMAAQYQNAQTRAQLQWKQVQFRRQAALEMENYKRQLYGQIFGGVGSMAGVGLGMLGSANKNNNITPMTNANFQMPNLGQSMRPSPNYSLGYNLMDDMKPFDKF